MLGTAYCILLSPAPLTGGLIPASLFFRWGTWGSEKQSELSRDKELSRERLTSSAAVGHCQFLFRIKGCSASGRDFMFRQSVGRKRSENFKTHHTKLWGLGRRNSLPPLRPSKVKKDKLALPQAWASCQRWALIKALGLLLEFLCSRTYPIRKRSHIFGPF